MSFITFFLSLCLIASGGGALVLGFDIVTTERGLALTLCGTMALSIGVVVLALGFILVRLGRLNLAQSVAEIDTYSDTETNQDIGLRSDLPNAISTDEISTNLSAMKSASNVSTLNTPPFSSYKTAGALAAGAGVLAAGAGLASTFSGQEPLNAAIEPAPRDGITLDIEAPLVEASHIDPSFNTDERFTDLDKLISELDATTPVTPPLASDMVKYDAPEGFENIFAAELHSETMDYTQFEGISVEHVLPSGGDANGGKASGSETSGGEDSLQSSQVKTQVSEIIGTYDSGGVTYTLYADGGVVAEAGDRQEHYSSLEALKAALEDGTSVFKS